MKRLIGRPQEALLCAKAKRQRQCFICAKAKRQRQSAQSERKSTTRFGDEPNHNIVNCNLVDKW
ncbi:hypothetical protein [Bacillus sp. RS11]|uniref:hypothetical protein n=1 Tax=Lysinibacillus sp. RS11 TaxID=3242682 RepID=UPI0035C77CAB